MVDIGTGRLAKERVMYEDIDTDDVPEKEPAPRKRLNRIRIGFLIFFGVAALIIAALFMAPEKIEPVIDKAALEAERTEYQAAITETSDALRRARLADFITTYPESESVSAAKAQFNVLNTQEQSDWAGLSFVIYDTEATRIDKLSALEIYKRKWNVALLGGREADVARIEKLLERDEEFPDRDLAIDPDAFPEAVDRDTLVGGGFDIQGTYIPPSVTKPDFEVEPEREVVIRAPRLRRNARPRYPSRAERRGVEATVVLELYISESGRVEETELISVDAPRYRRDFVRASERAARRLRFYPRTVNGTPVPTEGVEKRFRFTLGD